MADPTDLDPAGGVADVDEARGQGMPRWVKAFLIIGLVLVLAFVVGKFTGVGGDHGPGRHGSNGTAPGVDDDGGHRSPMDHRP